MSFYLKLTLPLKEMFLKSSTEGVWNSNGVVQWAIPEIRGTPEEDKHILS